MPERIAGRDLRLTNTDKVLYPSTGTTKGSVIDYYLEVAPALLPLARGRPVTRKRWPNGVGTADLPEASFFRKDLEQGAPVWVPRVSYRHRTTTNVYPLANEPAVLAWFGQLAALELHVPQWRFDNEEEPANPDRLVLDLDPGPGTGLGECVEVALICKELLDDMGLDSVPVTSGSKGIHLYAALDGTLTSEDAAAVAKRLAGVIAEERPDLVTANMRKDQRGGRVLIDWSQNNAAKTTVCPYSLRGRPRPTVAAPRLWEELTGGDLRQLSFRQVLRRLEQGCDPFKGFVPVAGGPTNGLANAPTNGPTSGQAGGGGSPRRRRASAQAPGGEDDDEERHLAVYLSRRDPARTPEPFPGGGRANGADPVFVIQRHEARRVHHDVRFERDGVLASWAVPKGPPLEPGVQRLAVRTEDHPLEYAAFEGEIPRGEYGAGTVRIWDEGGLEVEKWQEGRIVVVLHPRPGGGLGGRARRYAMVRTGPARENWLMHLVSDQPPPRPMLASRATPASLRRIEEEPAAWACEMKWDGIRAIGAVTGEGARFMSRNGQDLTGAYPELAELGHLARRGVVVDGEIVALGKDGAPDFGALQSRTTRVHYMVFDLLAGAGGSLLAYTYDERRGALLDALRPGSRVVIPPALPGDVAAAMEVSAEVGLEGVVAKRRASTYSPGRRSEDWVKVTHERHQEVVVVGWRPGERGGLASLILAVHEEGRLMYAGRVGTGFTEAQRTSIPAQLAALETREPGVRAVPPEAAADARWIEPVRVGEVSHRGLTCSGALRHPVWRGWRVDRDAREVGWEAPNQIPGTV